MFDSNILNNIVNFKEKIVKVTTFNQLLNYEKNNIPVKIFNSLEEHNRELVNFGFKKLLNGIY